MTEKHKRQEILACLTKETIGVLATFDKKSGNIRQRVMYYGIDENLALYLMSTKESPKISQILTSNDVSFIIFGLEDPYDNSWEIEIVGTAELMDKKEDVDYALRQLTGRNPFADVAIESGISGQFDVIKLNPKIVKFSLYGEALKGELPTVLGI